VKFGLPKASQLIATGRYFRLEAPVCFSFAAATSPCFLLQRRLLLARILSMHLIISTHWSAPPTIDLHQVELR